LGSQTKGHTTQKRPTGYVNAPSSRPWRHSRRARPKIGLTLPPLSRFALNPSPARGAGRGAPIRMRTPGRYDRAHTAQNKFVRKNRSRVLKLPANSAFPNPNPRRPSRSYHAVVGAVLKVPDRNTHQAKHFSLRSKQTIHPPPKTKKIAQLTDHRKIHHCPFP